MNAWWVIMTYPHQRQVINDVYTAVNGMLTGAKKAQKALLTFFENDKQGKPKGKWEIVVIDSKMKDSAHLPDASAANSEILFAMGQNPAMSGQGNTGGSYSDRKSTRLNSSH